MMKLRRVDSQEVFWSSEKFRVCQGLRCVSAGGRGGVEGVECLSVLGEHLLECD